MCMQVYPGFYFTGDGCRRDSDGYYWLIGEHPYLNMADMYTHVWQ